MRELKFRVFSSATLGVYYVPTESFSLVFHDTGNLVQLWSSDGLIDEFPACEIMQYTDLNDKNGRLIYEGDIVRMNWIKTEYIGYVEFNNGSFNLVGNNKIVICGMGKIYCDSCVIIGNIHENKDLLNG